MEHYDNLTLKDAFAIQWIAANCDSKGHLLKVDDDVIINLSYAQNFMKIAPLKRSVLG